MSDQMPNLDLAVALAQKQLSDQLNSLPQWQKTLLERAAKNNPTSMTPVGPYAHGPSGVWNTQGTDLRVFSAMQLPMGGLADQLPVIDASLAFNNEYGGPQAEYFSYLTGVTKGDEDFDDQPTEECADGARAGLIKSGEVAISYGYYRHSPHAPINLKRAGTINDLADPIGMNLVNQPADLMGFGTLGAGAGAFGQLLNREFSFRLAAQHVTMRRFLAPRVYTGTPANNNGAARDIMGLNLWINTSNKVDRFGSHILTALDSDVKNFGYNKVTGNRPDIAEWMEMVLGALDWRGTRQGFGFWDGWVVMRPELFDILTGIWPVRQIELLVKETARLGNTSLNIDGTAALEFRNQMRTELFLPLRGRRIMVIPDDSIPEETPNQTAELEPGQYASSIYFVPRSVLGGTVPVTFWKMFNFNNAQAQQFIQNLRLQNHTFTSDGGFFSWDVNYKNMCIDWTTHWSPALIMLTPQLAGRIDDVAYEPLQKYNSWNPDDKDTGYFKDGGRTTTEPTPYYVPWSPDTPTNI